MGNIRGEQLVHDQDLPETLATDLEGNFEQLVFTYQDRLYAFALRLSGSPQDAEEIVQDALVRAYEALRSYAAQRVRDMALRPWLYQITINVFRNRVRGRHLQLVPLIQEDQALAVDPADDPQARPHALLEQGELQHRLGAILAALPERYRVVVVLRHIQGLAYGEIAAVLEQPIGTVKANVHRGLRLLREALDKSEDAAQVRPTRRASRERQGR
jgi:RNA polymerase sigma-70 factor (ECF subfamily)